MESNLDFTVMQEKREETIDKILSLIEKQFEEAEVTALFTKKLLEDTIKVLETRAMLSPLASIKHSMSNRK